MTFWNDRIMAGFSCDCIILIYGDSIKEVPRDVHSAFPLNSNHTLSRPFFSALVDSPMEEP